MKHNDYFWNFHKVRENGKTYRLSTTTGLPLISGLPESFKAPVKLLDYKQACCRLKRENAPVDFGVHFYMEDVYLERFYRKFDKYLNLLKRVDCMLTPDFSIIPEMTTFDRRYAVYRSRQLGQLIQEKGVSVVTTLQWGPPDTFDYCFSDVPQHEVVSISTVGIAKTKSDSYERAFFRAGFKEVIQQLKPRLVLLYGTCIPECEFGDTPFCAYPNSHFPTKKTNTGKEVSNG